MTKQLRNWIPPEVAEWLAKPENEGCSYVPVKSLDEKGRCCGRKPSRYKNPDCFFCPECDAEYDASNLMQKDNFAYASTVGGVIKFRNHILAHRNWPRPKND